jgi:hypothetical protein
LGGSGFSRLIHGFAIHTPLSPKLPAHATCRLLHSGLATSQTAGTLNEMRNNFQATFFFTSAVLAHEIASKLEKRIKHILFGKCETANLYSLIIWTYFIMVTAFGGIKRYFLQ